MSTAVFYERKGSAERKSSLPESAGSVDDLLLLFVAQASPAEQTAFLCSFHRFISPSDLLSKMLAR